MVTLDRDFSQWINSANLEFFADGRGSGARLNRHWDQGEELPDERDELGPGVLDGGVRGFEEFATISERHYIGVDFGVDAQDLKNRKIHDAYQAYFRTMVYVDGTTREANVEYMLLDPRNKDRYGNPSPPVEVIGERMAELVLVKVIRYHDINPKQLMQVAENFPIVRRRVEVASNITDFKLEYWVENPFHPRKPSGFRTPAADAANPSEIATRPKEIEGSGRRKAFTQYRKVFGYGSMHPQAVFQRAFGYKAREGDRAQQGEHLPVRFGFLNANQIQFSELTQDDEIFVFNEATRGGRAGANALPVSFRSGDYTIRSNTAGLLQFKQPIDSSSWRREQDGPHFYKASFVPAAVRVTLRVVDDRGANPKTLQREIWIRRKTR